MPVSYKQVPILLIDVAGFTKIEGLPAKRALLERLQEALTAAARFFMPYGRVWEKWRRHGTGDGYYFIFDALPPAVALQYAVGIDGELAAAAARDETDLPIRLRMVLVIGDAELVDDQLLSDQFSIAERFVSFDRFKWYAEGLATPTALAIDSLFHAELLRDLSTGSEFVGLQALKWSRVQVTDKHSRTYDGYVLGDGWSGRRDRARARRRPEPKGPATPVAQAQARITILIGYSLDDPLPEAIETAKSAAIDLIRSSLAVELRVDLATIANLRREARRGCDVLIYYGHGSSDGRLVFADGAHTATELSESADLQTFWQSLPVFMAFAYNSEQFTRDLPSPSVAFIEPIARTSPTGFFHALIAELRGGADVGSAINLAISSSSCPSALRLSEQPIPPLTIAAGTPRFARASAHLANRWRADFGGRDSDVPYTEHDPFAGRAAELRTLLSLPSAFSDKQQQRVVWVDGDAGMGKSALLRQFGMLARDIVFHEENEEPVFVLHLNCWNFTAAQQLEKELCKRAAALYPLETIPADIVALTRALETKERVHVWVLDDLTGIAGRDMLHGTDEAERLVGRIGQAARDSALAVHLVVSHRRPGPTQFETMHVGPLSSPDARVLARLVCARCGVESDDDGAERLFDRVHQSIAHYKRGLVLAIFRNLSFDDYAAEVDRYGSLEQISSYEFSLKMLELELAHLDGLSNVAGFDYREFLSVYYPLIAKSGWFTLEELEAWFGDRLWRRESSVDRNVAYRNGVSQLRALNFLALGPGHAAFSMPPNQRLPMLAIARPDAGVPEDTPPRGHLQRISLAMERIRASGLQALADLDVIIDDYARYPHSDWAIEAALLALERKAEVLYQAGRKEDARRELERLVHWGDGASPTGAREAMRVISEALGRPVE